MQTNLTQYSLFDEVWARITAASGIGYVAVAYSLSRWLTRRSPATPVLPSEFIDARCESIDCTTSDGIGLKGWCIEPAHPRATIALFHGLRDNRSHTLGRVAFLTEAGYRCVAFDHRAHGESGGHFTSFGFHERLDVEAVLKYVHCRWPGERHGALGISMGAAALCFAGAASRGFDALILESLYHDLPRAFQHRIGVLYPAWIRHFRRGLLWCIERRLGTPITDIAPIERIADLAPRPVLLLTGSEDGHAPPHEVRALADQLPQTGQFHLIPGAGHEDVCTVGGAAYRDLLLDFLECQLFNSTRPYYTPAA